MRVVFLMGFLNGPADGWDLLSPEQQAILMADPDDDEEDFTAPEGADDSPDQGVHRYDGGGTFF